MSMKEKNHESRHIRKCRNIKIQIYTSPSPSHPLSLWGRRQCHDRQCQLDKNTARIRRVLMDDVWSRAAKRRSRNFAWLTHHRGHKPITCTAAEATVAAFRSASWPPNPKIDRRLLPGKWKRGETRRWSGTAELTCREGEALHRHLLSSAATIWSRAASHLRPLVWPDEEANEEASTYRKQTPHDRPSGPVSQRPPRSIFGVEAL
jgi:hypothetical protein